MKHKQGLIQGNQYKISDTNKRLKALEIAWFQGLFESTKIEYRKFCCSPLKVNGGCL